MLVPDIEVEHLSLITVGITRQQSKFSRSYPFYLTASYLHSFTQSESFCLVEWYCYS